MWTIITCHSLMESAIVLSISLRKPSEHTCHCHRVKDKLWSASFLPDRWEGHEAFLLLTLSPVYKLVGFLVTVLDLLMQTIMLCHFLVYPTEQISKTYILCSSGWVRFVVFCYHDTSTVYFVNTKVCFLGINYHSLLLEVLRQA